MKKAKQIDVAVEIIVLPHLLLFEHSIIHLN
jgi:hypothetical protein